MIATGLWSPTTGLPSRTGRRLTGRRHDAVRADINVTPLVDVVLVLLIIFMVVTPLLGKGVTVELPVTQHHDRRRDDNRDVVVAITAGGDVYVGSQRVTVDRVGETVLAERQQHPDKMIYLKGDARLRYAQARRVMESLHASGIDDLELATDEAKGSEKAR